jgi:hypothetical protein
MTTLIIPVRELPHQSHDASNCPCHTQGMTHLILSSPFGYFDMGLVSGSDPRVRYAHEMAQRSTHASTESACDIPYRAESDASAQRAARRPRTRRRHPNRRQRRLR